MPDFDATICSGWNNRRPLTLLSSDARYPPLFMLVAEGGGDLGEESCTAPDIAMLAHPSTVLKLTHDERLTVRTDFVGRNITGRFFSWIKSSVDKKTKVREKISRAEITESSRQDRGASGVKDSTLLLADQRQRLLHRPETLQHIRVPFCFCLIGKRI